MTKGVVLTMNVLHLTLKKKWFDMILAGEKKEEYREIKDHWAMRFIDVLDSDGMEFQCWEEMLNDMRKPFHRHNGPYSLLDYFGVRFRHYDAIRFVNGYGKDRPTFTIRTSAPTIKRGREEWGAEIGKYYFTFGLGTILDGAGV